MTIKASRNRAQKAPEHLRPETQRWWLAVNADYELDNHHRLLLTEACGALDRAAQAREVISREGAYFVDRLGAKRAHPACAIELANRRLFASILRELGLDAPTDKPRPPALPGYGVR